MSAPGNGVERAAYLCGRDWSPVLKDVVPFIGTPVFGGKPEVEYLTACEEMAYIFGLLGVEWMRCRPASESLITRGRNRIAAEFLNTKGATHLMFIDADIWFTPPDVFALIETGHKLVGGAYPRKQIEWGWVADAARNGASDPEACQSSYVVNLLPEDVKEGAVTFDDKGCVEVAELPTGFMLIAREVLEEMREKLPDLEYRDDGGPGSRSTMWNFFPDPVVTEANGVKRHLSEDYAFSRAYRSIGGKCMLHPDLELHHVGRHVFRANKDTLFLGAIR